MIEQLNAASENNMLEVSVFSRRQLIVPAAFMINFFPPWLVLCLNLVYLSQPYGYKSTSWCITFVVDSLGFKVYNLGC